MQKPRICPIIKFTIIQNKAPLFAGDQILLNVRIKEKYHDLFITNMQEDHGKKSVFFCVLFHIAKVVKLEFTYPNSLKKSTTIHELLLENILHIGDYSFSLQISEFNTYNFRITPGLLWKWEPKIFQPSAKPKKQIKCSGSGHDFSISLGDQQIFSVVFKPDKITKKNCITGQEFEEQYKEVGDYIISLPDMENAKVTFERSFNQSAILKFEGLTLDWIKYNQCIYTPIKGDNTDTERGSFIDYLTAAGNDRRRFTIHPIIDFTTTNGIHPLISYHIDPDLETETGPKNRYVGIIQYLLKIFDPFCTITDADDHLLCYGAVFPHSDGCVQYDYIQDAPSGDVLFRYKALLKSFIKPAGPAKIADALKTLISRMLPTFNIVPIINTGTIWDRYDVLKYIKLPPDPDTDAPPVKQDPIPKFILYLFINIRERESREYEEFRKYVMKKQEILAKMPPKTLINYDAVMFINGFQNFEENLIEALDNWGYCHNEAGSFGPVNFIATDYFMTNYKRVPHKLSEIKNK